ncbi:MAG TPA: peptidyl-prolyl cis-trans isomerase [Epsilonproteobacteria bacterium]|nr:peptidyl-prolyl cis-trans isomerase [Campylobacterota bacterium]
MKKLVLLTLLSFLSFSHAKMVDGIACIVEGEPVTTAEIRAIQRQYHLSKKEATDLLIKDRLQKSAMRDIVIDETKIDAKIANIAKQNNLTVPKMQKILKGQGTSWAKYRTSIRMALKKEKFYQEHVINTIPAPTEDELKIFYRNHKKEFFMPSSISLVEYTASTESGMKKFLQTKKKSGIKSHSVRKMTKDLDPTMLGTFMQTQNGHYTRPFNAGDRYISYKVLSKNGKTAMSFNAARGAVAAKWKQQQQSKALKDYFEKLKTNCDVEMLR